jgi:hypothetical protein
MVLLRKLFLQDTLKTISLGIVLASFAPAQDPGKLRELVEAGALPRAALARAEAEAADRDDEAALRRTLYGALGVEDLDGRQAAGMLAAARRRVERAGERLAEARPLVEQGLVARASLAPLEEELSARRGALLLAERRARVFDELLEMARAEAALAAPADEGPKPVQERFDGDGRLTQTQLKKVILSFEKQFSLPLPVSAHGGTAVHRSMGFDHRGRVDVALNPDQPEGQWLREFLERERIPYYAFRAAVPGRATAAHIHIGPPSLRLRVAD